MTNKERQSVRAINAITNDLDVMRNECASRPLVIDWEQRRYEIAKEVLPQLMKMEVPSGDFIDYEMKEYGEKPIVKGEYSLFMRACVRMAMDCADLLIDRLKKGGEK